MDRGRWAITGGWPTSSLPQADAAVDVVTSAFGAMVATRVDAVISQLARVLRTVGVLAMANWVPGGPATATAGADRSPVRPARRPQLTVV